MTGDVANEQPWELEATVAPVKAKITFYTFNIQWNRIYITIPKCREGSKGRPKLSRTNSRFCSSMSVTGTALLPSALTGTALLPIALTGTALLPSALTGTALLVENESSVPLD